MSVYNIFAALYGDLHFFAVYLTKEKHLFSLIILFFIDTVRHRVATHTLRNAVLKHKIYAKTLFPFYKSVNTSYQFTSIHLSVRRELFFAVKTSIQIK